MSKLLRLVCVSTLICFVSSCGQQNSATRPLTPISLAILSDPSLSEPGLLSYLQGKFAWDTIIVADSDYWERRYDTVEFCGLPGLLRVFFTRHSGNQRDTAISFEWSIAARGSHAPFRPRLPAELLPSTRSWPRGQIYDTLRARLDRILPFLPNRNNHRWEPYSLHPPYSGMIIPGQDSDIVMHLDRDY